MKTRSARLLACVALAAIAGCQLIAGIDSRSVYEEPAEAGLPDTSTGGDAGPTVDAADAGAEAAHADSGEPCSKDNQRECLTATQPRVCTNGFWKLDLACGGTTPGCRDGVCVSSCTGVPNECGPNHDQNCCASDTVAKHAYFRSFDSTVFTDAGFPANVGDFRLDRFEVTVGRFRSFVNAYPKSLPSAGAGKNGNEQNDPGWDDSWNALMPADRDALASKLNCNNKYATWTGTAVSDDRAINCITWYEAQAFCIWDGGRLPTEAEWNAAAAGGEQRAFPWGADSPADAGPAAGDAGFASFGCVAAANCDTFNVMHVGSFPRGASKYGHFDLAGNVHEWVIDYFAEYPLPCDNCARHAPVADAGLGRVIRGGDYGSPIAPPPPPPDIAATAGSIMNGFRGAWDPAERSSRHGIRCARAAN